MELRLKLSGLIAAALTLWIPMAHADFKDESEFAAHGSIANVLEENLNKYLLPFEVQQIGNAVYNEGVVYGAAGQQVTSSSPHNEFVSKHQNGYCSPNITIEKNSFQCTGQQGNLSNEPDPAASAQYLEMGDIRTSVLLEPLVYTQAIDYAAQNYIRNLTMPFPSLLFANYITNIDTFVKSNKQKSSFATFLSQHGLLSVARYALDEMYGMRLPGSTIGNGAASGDASSRSIMQMMEEEATRRFNDGGYVSFLTAGSTTQVDLLRDMAAMQAFSLWMDYQNYRQNERIAALLAASLANNVSGAINGSVVSAEMTR